MSEPAYLRPGSQEERIRLRGCRNCIAWDSTGQQCRSRFPFGYTEPTAWCTDWRARWEPRVVWDSAFAPVELRTEQGYLG